MAYSAWGLSDGQWSSVLWTQCQVGANGDGAAVAEKIGDSAVKNSDVKSSAPLKTASIANDSESERAHHAALVKAFQKQSTAQKQKSSAAIPPKNPGLPGVSVNWVLQRNAA